MSTKLTIAVQGCAHGELNSIYRSITTQYASKLPDLLIILGDFQSLRSEEDMASIAVPDKYKKLGDFPKYYNGELKAPLPTIFIGGNHECMRGLLEIPSGGFVAKNIYYMGYSGSIVVQGVVISGLSGIYKRHDFNTRRPTLEQIEKEGWSRYVRNLYHVRKADVLPLFMLKQTDVMLSHDWPNGVAHYGDLKKLLKLKPFFKQDIQNNNLGSPVSWQLMRNLMPQWWLSAHLHVKFESEVSMSKRSLEEKNPDEIDLDLDLDPEASETAVQPKVTKFLALDKCGRNRKHMDIIVVDSNLNHPTYDPVTFKMYLNPEFVANQKYLAQNEQNARLEDINFEEVRQQRGDLATVKWEDYELTNV
ncbi:LANO_0H09362g1_1 [Lachancea nothofagi CBS 11611]|uniref:LANO_0H09362g1_1 n=1 Tax=Lachancea nothofagi CBS 11611 TaxID=1266666 RepID=A0A1G4KLR8_9SACH|nr:LANO_0H09362g1_1 [Lachancea nothofagi CBS 11611]